MIKSFFSFFVFYCFCFGNASLFSIQDSVYKESSMYDFYGMASWNRASKEQKNKMVDDFLIREGAYILGKKDMLDLSASFKEKAYNKHRQLLVNYVYQLDVSSMGMDSSRFDEGKKHLKEDLLVHHILFGHDGSALREPVGRLEEEAYVLCGEVLDTLTLEGFEGPIDVLLSLAREQKVDLTQISILELAQQYLEFVQQAQSLNLEVAADYLVMAAWLAYLKSRILLPRDEEGENSTPEELAEALRFQLRRLEAMRKAGSAILQLPQLGLDVFSRGMPELISNVSSPIYELSLFELLKSYGQVKVRGEVSTLSIVATRLYSVDEAIERLKNMLGNIPDWQDLIGFLPDGLNNNLLTRSAVASTFVASLELAKEGYIELKQNNTYGPIFVRPREM